MTGDVLTLAGMTTSEDDPERDATPINEEAAREDDKPIFEARELSEPAPYTGPERRKGNRRSGVDRRKNIRFELDKEDRRQSYGRRKGDCSENLGSMKIDLEVKTGN